LELVKQTVSEWIDQDVSRMGAALAFYTLSAVAPLFVVELAMAGRLTIGKQGENMPCQTAPTQR
jgi:uncharacterized BrkB/YihY/UPF0761 family membrane protein